MDLTEEYLAKIKMKLKAVGWVDQGQGDFEFYITKKHYNRQIDLINWMKSNDLETLERDVSNAYRADVVVRSMLQKILKPIELEIVAHICYFLEMNQINLGDLIMRGFYREFDMTSYWVYKKEYKTYTWFVETIKEISNKYNTNDLNLIFPEMTLGQIGAFISLLKEDAINSIFGDNSSSFDVYTTINKFVSLRNHIAHHDIIFSLKGIRHNGRKINIAELVDSLHILAKGDYKKALQTDVERYRDNSIRKYESDTYFVEENVKKLFDVIISNVNTKR